MSKKKPEIPVETAEATLQNVTMQLQILRNSVASGKGLDRLQAREVLIEQIDVSLMPAVLGYSTRSRAESSKAVRDEHPTRTGGVNR
jgi:hypothetical protein